jgi:hypothetical protein
MTRPVRGGEPPLVRSVSVPLRRLIYSRSEWRTQPHSAMSANEDLKASGQNASVVNWLLQENQPAVRYRALVDLLGRKESDPDVRRTRAQIPRVGWAHEQLRLQGPKGFWEPREPKNLKDWIEFLYFPVFGGTNWRALVLSDLGLDATNPRVKKIADLLFDYKLRLSSPFNFYHEEVCISANTARILTRFGYADDPRVGRLYDWLIEDQRTDGGWNCSQGTPGTLDAWEPLAAFASLPKSKRSPKMENAIARGAEFYLERKLMEEGRPYPPWLRLHYPNHYYYDILVGLDVLTQLGFGGDRRLRPALKLLADKRQRDGTWLMDRLHPDIGPQTKIHPDKEKIKPLLVEEAGKPSKWITMKALRVLKAVEEAA